MLNLYNQIVPKPMRKELIEGAKTASDFMWLIADRAVWIYNDCCKRKKAGRLPEDLCDYQVWNAIGHYACKSGPRVRAIALVGARFSHQTRKQITSKYGEWEFGYYERIAKMADEHWNLIFQFLNDYEAGDITHPQPGRRLGVGEFIFLFEKHILGIEKHMQEPKDNGLYLESATISLFQAILDAGYSLRKRLQAYQHQASVSRVLHLLDRLENALPEAMREVGIPVDKEEEVSV